MADNEKEVSEAEAAQEAEVSEASLIDQIMEETRIKPSDEGYDTARKGVAAFISDMLGSARKGEKVEQKVVDEMIAEIDKKISGQVDAIMHNEHFQKLESAWRGLKLVIDRTDFRENIKLEMMSVSKEELLEDFEDAPEITKSGLYMKAYTAEYGQFGGQPYGAIISNYELGPGAQDVNCYRMLPVSVPCLTRPLSQMQVRSFSVSTVLVNCPI